MKKIISVAVIAAMLMAVFSLNMSAESHVSTDTVNKVYVSGTGDDATAEAGNKEKPYGDFLTAYGQLTETGGTVVLLDDITVDLSSYTPVSSAHRYKLPVSSETISVCGTYDSENDKYSTMTFVNCTSAPCIELQGDVVFYDIEFSVSEYNLWFAANGYRLTFGFNVKNVLSDGKGANACGWVQGKKVGATQSTSSGPEISIYSGNWDRVFASGFVSANYTKDVKINIFGGIYKTGVYMCQSTLYFSGNAICNLWGGNIAALSGAVASGKTSVLNIYNGAENDITPANFTTTNTMEKAQTPAPEYAVDFRGVQETSVADGKYSVRFAGVVDALKFDAVGFEIIANESTDYSCSCRYVYNSLNAGAEAYDVVTAASLGGNYIYALAINNIPVAAGEVSFKVTPFVAVGETVYYGDTYNVTYNAGSFVAAGVAE